MQSINQPLYVYDATGRMVNYSPAGASNDVVSNTLSTTVVANQTQIFVSGGLKPTILNAKKLFVDPLSKTSPPVEAGNRPKTDASILGYASFDDIPEVQDIYSITTAKPAIQLTRTEAQTTQNVVLPHANMSPISRDIPLFLKSRLSQI